MTVIELPDEQAAALKAKADAAGLTLEAWLQQLAAEEERPPTHPPQHIADVICENMRDVPPGNHGEHAPGRCQPTRPLHLRLAQKRGMTALFADTFYWIALVDFNDSAHRRALALSSERADSPIVTTDEVLVEYLTFFATAPGQIRRKALINARRILDDPGVRVPQSRESFLAGMALYEARPDKGYSLVDCISNDAQGKADRGAHQ